LHERVSGVQLDCKSGRRGTPRTKRTGTNDDRVLPEPPISEPVERIALVRASNIGDFIAAVPAYRAVRRAYPRAQITLVTTPKVRPLVERMPHLIDRYAEFPGFPGVRERDVDPRRTLEFLCWAQAERFDLAIQLHGNGVWTNPFVALFAARFSAGFVRPEDSAHFMRLDVSVPFPAGVHEIRRLQRLLDALGIPPAGEHLEPPLRPEDEAEAEAVLRAAGIATSRPLLVIHPAGRFVDRTWQAERFVEAGREIAARMSPSIVVTGSPDDVPVASRVAAALGATSVAGMLSLPGLVGLIGRASLVLSNDSGPAHIAYATGAPSVTVFGTASPLEWGPLDARRHGIVAADGACHPCGGEPCIRRVRVEAVVDAAIGVLDRTSPGRAAPAIPDPRAPAALAS
jgi:ADP-heptose:LPS heptosyltransferase